MVRRLAVFCMVLALAGAAQAADTIWLVRHAEQTDPEAGDPALTEAGEVMAARLAAMLVDSGIEAVYSTDYRRTRATAAPLAGKLGLEVTLYDPEALELLAGQLRSAAGPCLVVGHSNTTPRLVELLGGDPAGAIGHKEFDRLYLVELRNGGADSILLRIP